MRPLLLIALLLSACESSTQFNPSTYGEVSVFISSEWLDLDKRRIRDQLLTMNRLGPRFVETNFGSTARVIVRRFESQNCEISGAGRHFLGTRVAEIDPVCTPGDTAFRTTVGHEIGHVLGMAHVCKYAGEVSDCSTVGFGDALMNPILGEDDDHAVPDPVHRQSHGARPDRVPPRVAP
jgi:hypothetical protein